MSPKKELKPGTIFLGKYKIIKKLATGSLGDDIYSAEDFQLNRSVAVRMIPPEVMDDEDLVQRFVQEIKISVALQHPNILSACEAGEHNGVHYLVTAAIDGAYVNTYIRQYGVFDERVAIDKIILLIDALKYAWERDNILHRDIRPETILIAKDGRPLLTDFGMAKTLSKKRSNKPVTAINQIIGDPAYMSPEQLKNLPDLDFRSDMYCLGLVFRQMLTGEDLFQNLPTQKIVELQLNQKPTPVHETRPSVSEECSKVIDKMLHKDRSKRYPAWDELVEDLKAVAAGDAPPSFDPKTWRLRKKKGSSSIIQMVGESVDPQNVSGKNKKLKVTLNVITVVILAAIIIGAVIIAVVALFSSSDEETNVDRSEIIGGPGSIAADVDDATTNRRELLAAVAARLVRGEFGEALEECQSSPNRSELYDLQGALAELARSESAILDSFSGNKGRAIVVMFAKGERKIVVKNVKDGTVYCLWRRPDGDAVKMRFKVGDLAISEQLKRLSDFDDTVKSVYVGVARCRAGQFEKAERAFQNAGDLSEPLLSELDSLRK